MVTLSSVRIAFAALCLSALVVDGFVAVPGTSVISRTTAQSATQLHGRRVMKRGSLGSIDNEDTDIDSPKATSGQRRSTGQQRKVKSTRKKKSASNKSGDVASDMSPDLAKFLEQSGDGSGDEAEIVQKGKKVPSPKRERRQKQSAKLVVDEARNAKIEIVLDELQEVLGERTGKVRDILTVVEKLIKIPSNDNNDLRRLLSARDRSDYRLAWVGSDDAICHVGTGLHKVPLARMQEVFMNCLGRNQIEILEVISLIGPFPNVKNVLQGTTEITSGGNGSEMQIVMDRMVDGTGKEIKPESEDSIRRVDLEVAFCNEQVIVVVMPDDDNENAKPLDDDGKRVLLFVREEELDDKLELLRVNELDKED